MVRLPCISKQEPYILEISDTPETWRELEEVRMLDRA